MSGALSFLGAAKALRRSGRSFATLRMAKAVIGTTDDLFRYLMIAILNRFGWEGQPAGNSPIERDELIRPITGTCRWGAHSPKNACDRGRNA